MHVHLETTGGWRILVIFLYHIPHYWLTSELPESPCLHSSTRGLQAHAALSDLYAVARSLNANLAFPASCLPSLPLSSPALHYRSSSDLTHTDTYRLSRDPHACSQPWSPRLLILLPANHENVQNLLFPTPKVPPGYDPSPEMSFSSVALQYFP